MKDFWTDMFYDLENNGEDYVAENWSKTIDGDFEKIEDAIREYDLRRALAIIEDCKGYY